MALLAMGTLRVPAVGFAALLCLFGLKQWGQSATALIAQHGTATNWAIGCLVLLGLLVRAMSGRCLLCRMPPVAWLVLLLYGYALLSVVWTPEQATALEQWRDVAPYLITIIVLGPMLIGTMSDVRQFAHWTVVIGAALMTLVLMFGHWGTRGLILLGDIYESQENPLAMASLAGTVTVFAVLSLQRGTLLLWRALLILIVPLGFAVIFRSASRGELIAAVVAAVAVWPVAYRQKNLASRVLWVAGAVAVVLTAWFASSLVEIDATRWSTTQSSADVEGRFAMAADLINRASASPSTFVFGLGNSSSFHYFGVYPHIAFLETLAEEGLLGAGLFLGIVYLAVRSVIRLVRTPGIMNRAERRTSVALLAGAFLFELILAMKEGSLLSCTYVFAYAIILGRLELLVRRPVARRLSATVRVVRRESNVVTPQGAAAHGARPQGS
jgi:hypothetical protein